MRYLYLPHRETEDRERSNQIRQWMATRALARVAPGLGDRGVALARLNLEYNLQHSYREEARLGFIDERGKVKLGAVAVAAMALMDHPERHRFVEQERALCATIDHLWRDSGRFRTFARPVGRDEFHNFYPGEALLAWSHLYRETRYEALLEKFMTSFRHYSEWHRRNRNPAFVPWHTKAYVAVWRHTQDDSLRDFVFEMNDWLVLQQQWEDAPELDCRGRFYAPGRAFGPPHASSTGVYLEGLADAFELARAVGDDDRRARYARTILRGLRSLAQLTFRDDADLFYLRRPEMAFGGVRTTVYDDAVRIDNVQHSLMAILDVLDKFEDADFRYSIR